MKATVQKYLHEIVLTEHFAFEHIDTVIEKVNGPAVKCTATGDCSNRKKRARERERERPADFRHFSFRNFFATYLLNSVSKCGVLTHSTS